MFHSYSDHKESGCDHLRYFAQGRDHLRASGETVDMLSSPLSTTQLFSHTHTHTHGKDKTHSTRLFFLLQSICIDGMASTANNSHATSSAVDEENWKYVECAKCREEAIIQDKEDPSNHTLRPDFHLTACGHIACEKCLQGLFCSCLLLSTTSTHFPAYATIVTLHCTSPMRSISVLILPRTFFQQLL